MRAAKRGKPPYSGRVGRALGALPTPAPLYRIRTGLPGPHPQRLLELEYPHLAVACLSRPSYVTYCFHHLLRNRVIHRELDLRLWQEVDAVLRAAIDLRMAMLSSVPVDLRDRHALDTDIRDCLAHLIDLERLDDSRNQLHASVPASSARPKRLGTGCAYYAFHDAA